MDLVYAARPSCQIRWTSTVRIYIHNLHESIRHALSSSGLFQTIEVLCAAASLLQVSSCETPRSHSRSFFFCTYITLSARLSVSLSLSLFLSLSLSLSLSLYLSLFLPLYIRPPSTHRSYSFFRLSFSFLFFCLCFTRALLLRSIRLPLAPHARALCFLSHTSLELARCSYLFAAGPWRSLCHRTSRCAGSIYFCK